MAVGVEHHGHTTVVTIDRPQRRNALDRETIGGIGAAFAAAEADARTRVVVLTGAGDRAFCAGMDLRAFLSGPGGAGSGGTGPRGEEPPGPGLEVFTTRCFPKPVIAAVNGAAVGGGFELVLAADLAIAADHAIFCVPEVRRGVVGAGCTTRLAARLPPAVVHELTLTGDPLSAARAAALGLVNEVVPADQVLPRALALGERIARNAPLALRVTKELVFAETRAHDAHEWAAIRRRAAPVFASADAREGATAFTERREPLWTGR